MVNFLSLGSRVFEQDLKDLNITLSRIVANLHHTKANNFSVKLSFDGEPMWSPLIKLLK